LLFDDVDPFRLPQAACSDGRTDLAPWRELLQRAWTLLVRSHPATAEEIASLITTLTPMVADIGRQASATLMCAFGAIGLSAPHDDQFLAMTLAHETQHAKLGALMDAVPMTRPDDRRMFYTPWRDDPRPISGMLQGAYAFLGVTGFWRTQRVDEVGRRSMYAHTEFARWRDGAALVTRTLLTSSGLTGPGRLFADEMMRTLEAWHQDAVPPEAAERASAAARKHLAEWRRRNGEPPPEQALS
jgi:HEXXH motif-containing protein